MNIIQERGSFELLRGDHCSGVPVYLFSTDSQVPRKGQEVQAAGESSPVLQQGAEIHTQAWYETVWHTM